MATISRTARALSSSFMQCSPASSSRSTLTPLARARNLPRPPPDPVRCRRTYADTPFPTARRQTVLKPINILVMLVPFVTFGLGVWQVKRLRWKLDLIDDIQRNIEKEPLILPPNINLNALPDFAFRRVLVKGKFEGPPLLLGPAVEQGIPGWNLILPFSRAASGGSTILVNRGFITERIAKAIRDGTELAPGLKPRTDGKDGEEVVIEGMLTKKFDEGKGRWTPENKPEENQWFWKDLIAMAEYCSKDGRAVQPVFVDTIENGNVPFTYMMHQGEPIGKPPTVEIRNQHATYAVIWFTLSVSTAAMTVYLLRSRARGALRRKQLTRMP